MTPKPESTREVALREAIVIAERQSEHFSVVRDDDCLPPALRNHYNGMQEGASRVAAVLKTLLSAPAVEAGEGKDWLEDQEFYEVCQTYRHASDIVPNPIGAAQAFEALKQFIRERASPSAIRLAQEEMRERAANEAMKWNYQSGANNRDRKACAEECAERIRSLPTQPVAQEDS